MIFYFCNGVYITEMNASTVVILPLVSTQMNNGNSRKNCTCAARETCLRNRARSEVKKAEIKERRSSIPYLVTVADIA